jgi:hypothetical protein
VQEGANIRLRHLNPSSTAKLAHQSYGRLKADDLRWAEGMAIVLETAEPAALGEIVQNLDLFTENRDAVSRIVYVTGDNAVEGSVRDLREKFKRAGLRLLREEMTDSTTNLALMTQIGQRLAQEKP